MMITITGSPCSGKSTVARVFTEKYNFESMSTGKILRQMAQENGMDIVEFQKVLNNDKSIDLKIEDMQREIGRTRIQDDLLLDSRLGWFCVPDSFKVYVTIPDHEMARRFLADTEREGDIKVETEEDALKALNYRRNQEVERYKKTYGIDLTDANNYDLVVENYRRTPEETAEIIYSEYKKYVEKHSK